MLEYHRPAAARVGCLLCWTGPGGDRSNMDRQDVSHPCESPYIFDKIEENMLKNLRGKLEPLLDDPLCFAHERAGDPSHIRASSRDNFLN